MLKQIARIGVIMDASETDDVGIEAKTRRRRRLLSEIVEEITANGGGLRMSENLSREELYGERFNNRDSTGDALFS